jgi:hypothetical protein
MAILMSLCSLLISEETNVKLTTKLGVVTTPVISALGRLRQKDDEFQASLGYMYSKTPSQKPK